ncbi:MAG: type II secretion system F family protein [Phycisphaeraceae bacterium]
MKLAYQALNASGHVVSDIIEADDAMQAADLLHRKGLFATDLQPVKAGKKTAKRKTGWQYVSTNKRLRLVASFARHLHVLLKSGASLVTAINAVERQSTDPAWRAMLVKIRERLEEGIPMSEAMEQHPRYFDAIACSLVSAGESSGKLDDMFARLGSLTHNQLHLRRQVQGALTYPIMVLFVGFGMVAMLISVVLPRFSTLFETMNVPLPPLTKAMIVSSELFTAYWWGIVPALLVIVAGIVRYFASDIGRSHVQTLLVRAPLVKTVTQGFVSARIARLLGVLLASHVDLLDALRLTRTTVSNHHYQALLERAEEATAQGSPLSTSFGRTELIPVSLYEALKNGEETGTTDTLLITVAEFMDEDNEIVLKAVLNMLGPAVLVFIGLLVGAVAVSLFLPLFDLTASAGGN